MDQRTVPIAQATFACISPAAIFAPLNPDNADFLEGCNDVVSIEIDANASTATDTARRGAPKQRYISVPGLGSVPCRVVQKQSAPSSLQIAGRQDVTAYYRVLIGIPVNLDKRHRLVWIDRQTSQTRYLYVIGESTNAHQMNVFWPVNAVEYAN
ncbi:MAG: hypothetical protein KGL39_39280 [Patescibacteria group bacterium]|nr:hypothetical protein [Patescibacteria group bacterium]